jgi:diguanylate cyclase (GGDEF)-like protein
MTDTSARAAAPPGAPAHLTSGLRARRPWPSTLFDSSTLLAGCAVMAIAFTSWARSGRLNPWLLCAVPLVVLMARYPLKLLRQEGDIEIGFDSAVLVVLALVAPGGEAMGIWSLGIIVAQGSAPKRLPIRLFNIGLGTTVGALAVAVMRAITPLGTTSPRELLAAALGCATYFVADFIITDVSLSLESGGRVFAAWRDGSVPLSFAVFVGIDTLGYVGAILVRDVPWALPLLAAPIVTLLMATGAFAKANKNQLLMTGLFDAALLAQAQTSRSGILDLLVQQVRRVLRSPRAGLRAEPPGPGEIGVLLSERAGADPSWLIAAPRVAGEAYNDEDRRALQTLAVLGRESLQRARLVEEMAHLARHDPLTGLPNRALFQDRVEHAVALQQRESRPLAVLFIDLDGFKGVNDSLGHDTGDQLLVAVADRLRGCLRPGDTVARLGGDEFAVLLERISAQQDAREVSERVLEALGAPFDVAGSRLLVGASIGIAVRRTGDGADALLRNSDLAMYRAKELGKGRYEFFEPTMLAENLERITMEGELRHVIELGQLRLLYQPVVDLADGRITGFEALLRWEHPLHGTIDPLRFVGIAEETGLILSIGEWVLERAYVDTARWVERFGTRLAVGVNVSGRQLKGRGLAEKVLRLREQYPADVELLLEITESVVVREDGESVESLRALRDLGVQVAIDDFGTGYSSIAYLRHLPVDVLKIDRSFVREVARDARSAALVDAITAMASALDLRLVAEGIEHVEQASTLRAMGCQFGQGYWFARPMPAEEVPRFLAAGTLDVGHDAAAAMTPSRGAGEKMTR